MHERPHQTGGVPAAERVGVDEHSPRPDGSAVVASRFGVASYSLECFGVAVREACAFGFEPLLEFGRVIEVETVQKGAPVFRHCVPVVASLDCRHELSDVAVDGIGVEPDGIHTGEDVLGHRAPERVEQLIQ